MFLFLDDERDPSDVTWIDLPLFNWTIVRSYDEFVKTIEANGLPKFISFDHDLAEEHYKIYTEHLPEFPYERCKEKTGFQCAYWLVAYCQEEKLALPPWTVHSLNPIGRQNINSLLNSFLKSLTL
jgi:hypothetical protein